MAFLSKLFGTTTSETKSKSGDTIEAIVKDVDNRPYGISENNVLYAGLNELGGYYFFQTVVVGQLNVKSKNGAVLVFKSDNFELELNSDMPEFESESSDIKGRQVTKIDFQIEENDIKLLETAQPRSVQLNVKKHHILFTKFIVSDEEE
ncbi:hypothetical protein [Winogradskyella bathintestinalis]|uniref:Uncharacterized protein n=1 Tax=Winogradskyella bathintestinalis TaxID=3035208 RepID=A0ABT7ZTQ1_9FLAO|nr:hypothetical protein [Winogradskyella bathintestinalis]MDN3492395.1 hypothetical protein [Winogradskyella bathintestinalis]